MAKLIFALLLLFNINSIAAPESVTSEKTYKEYLSLHYANHCSNYFDHFERKYQIPQHLLRSISLMETGRWHHQSKTSIPWPWAVNQAGKAYYFSSKQEAISKVKAMLELGLTNIDIGCMQINLHHHPEAFMNLNQAFEPKDNIEYAAKFLTRHYQQSGNWQQTIASYHSRAEIGQVYATKVLKIWSNYKDNKIESSQCIAGDEKVTLCNNFVMNNTISDYIREDKLPFKQADATYIIPTPQKVKKNIKRLQSSMIAYSISNE